MKTPPLLFPLPGHIIESITITPFTKSKLACDIKKLEVSRDFKSFEELPFKETYCTETKGQYFILRELIKQPTIDYCVALSENKIIAVLVKTKAHTSNFHIEDDFQICLGKFFSKTTKNQTLAEYLFVSK